MLVDGQHRLAAIVEADLPVEGTVFTDCRADTFDVLDTGNGATPSTCWRSRERSRRRCWRHSSP